MLPASSASLRTLHYFSPIIIIVAAAAFSLASACLLPPRKRAILSPAKRTPAKWASLALAHAYLVEGLFRIALYLGHGRRTNQAGVVYIVLFILLWFVEFLVLRDANTVYRLTNLATWILACVLEVIILVTTATDTANHFTVGFLVLRIALLSLLSALAFHDSEPDQSYRQFARETSDLLGRGSIESTANRHLYGTLSKAASASSEVQQSLHHTVGWWGWLRQFQTFLPHLIPFKDRRLQVYAICLVGLVLLSRALNLIGPKLLGDVVNKVVTLEDHGSIPWTPILEYIFLAKVPQELIVEPLKSILRNRLHYWAYKELLMASYSHIMGLSLDFHDNKESAEAYAAVDQSNRLNQLLDNLIMTAFPIVLDHVLILAYLSYLFDVYMGLILAVIFVAYTISTYKLTAICAPHQRECLQYTREQKKIQIESFSAWQEAAYINRQSYHIEQLHIATAKEIKHMAMFTDLSLIQQIGQNSIMILGYTAVLILAVYQIVHKNRPIGTFVALLMYWSQLTRPIYQLAFAYKDIVGYAVEAEPLLRIMQTAPTVVDSAGAPNLTPRGGKVEFSRVSFTYDTRQDFIKDLSFTVVAGSTVAFVGQTGAGKTTICNKLLFRFYDVTGGSIQIDGQDIRDVTQHSLRETIGIVPQDPVFLSTTVLEAVRYARLNATDEEVYNACKAAAIHDSILRKPCGYQHQIGDRGCKLSGGEKQRLAIARVFLRDPEIIVLDEATSTVDNLSEAKIQQALSNVCRGKTTFVIAHRLSTVMHADQIFVLDQGRIAERGTHDELLQLKGRYWQLWYKKVLKDELDGITEINPAEHDGSGSSTATDLIDLSDESASIEGSFEILNQLDGQGGSKQMEGSNPARTNIRRKLHDFKGRLHKKPSRRNQDEDGGDVENDEGTSETSPMKTISPTPTNTTIAELPKRRSLSLMRKRASRGSKCGTSGDEQPFIDPVRAEEDGGTSAEDGFLLSATSQKLTNEIVPRHPSATLTNPSINEEDHEDLSRYHTPATPSTKSNDEGTNRTQR